MSLGFFMTLLDLTIVNIAIPDMITRLHATLDGVLWVINAYALVLAVLLITAGRLGDLFGQRRLFIVGVITVHPRLRRLRPVPDVGWLVAFRAIQGVGAALLLPQTLAILTTVFPPERRGAAFGIWGAVAGVATIAGPTLGGLLVSAFDWRYIFYINLPIGALVIAMGIFLIPDVRIGARHRLDIPGVLLATGALLAICYGLVEGQKYSWGHDHLVHLDPARHRGRHRPARRVPRGPGADPGPGAAGAVRAVQGPQLQPDELGFRGPVDRHDGHLPALHHLPAVRARLLGAEGRPDHGAGLVVSMFVAPAAGRLTDRIGGKYILLTGLMLFAIGFGLTAAIATTHSTWQDFIPTLAIAGVGMGCTFAPMTTIAMRHIEPRVAGAASGMINTVRQVGAVIGTAAVGALLQSRLAVSLPAAAAERAGALPPQARSQFVAGFAKAAQHGEAAEPDSGQRQAAAGHGAVAGRPDPPDRR